MTLMENKISEPEAQAKISRRTTRRTGRSGVWRALAWILGSVGIVAAGVEVARLVIHARQYESTDDAFLDAHVVQISTKMAAYG
ncbi:MAG TPA: hypothetical protein VHD56_18030 [Tepidisphaeraceae bacterium]|nr:hypothetical protein [Tepidisphaeraceae bacterium]